MRGATIAVALFLAACGGQSNTPANTRTTVQPPSRIATALGGETETGDIATGKQLFLAKGCIACHVTGVTPGGGNVGPNLNGFARRSRIVETLDNTPENLRRWLQNPPAVKRGTLMPNVNLSPPEIDHLSAFMYSLQ